MAPHHLTTEAHNLNHAGQPADAAIEGAAAIRLDLGPNFGLTGPSVGGAVGHLIFARPQCDGRALRYREGWQGLTTFRVFCGWHWLAVNGTISPTLHFTPLTVLSLGARLVGTPSTATEMQG
jgi:hypothetical protein